MESAPDLASTLFVLPPDAKLLAVSELAPRLRDSLGPVDGDEVVITRPGFRISARQAPPPLAALLSEFRTASRLTDAIHRFSCSHNQDPQEILDLSFEALLSCISGRILVDATSLDAHASTPSLASGQAFAGMEVESLVRALDDTEVYLVRWFDGRSAALKLARDGRAASSLAHEAAFLHELNGEDTPHLFGHGTEGERAWLAIEWRDGVSVSVAAQQARTSANRTPIATIITNLLAAYARLHARGVIHGDIHTGNILVEDDGRITLIDFGRARRVGGALSDPRRVGVPYFYDPEMAEALLTGGLTPAATTQSEQHALAVLAYQLLTGLHAIDPSADQQELLSRIAARPPLPFVARGVAAWPQVEKVLARALSKQPQQRYQTTWSFAEAFNKAIQTPKVNPALPCTPMEEILASLPSGEALPGINRRSLAWLLLRAALVRSDEELLAQADVAIALAEPDWTTDAVSAHVARARGDRREEQNAMNRLLEAATRLQQEADRRQVLLAISPIVHGSEARGLNSQPLRLWAAHTLEELWPSANPEILQAGLALESAGVVRWPADGRARIDAQHEGAGSAWLWALAHDVFADPDYAERAKTSKQPTTPLLRVLFQLRLYQLTGDEQWLASAQQTATNLADHRPSFGYVLAMVELSAPARSILPPWRLLPEEEVNNALSRIL